MWCLYLLYLVACHGIAVKNTGLELWWSVHCFSISSLIASCINLHLHLFSYLSKSIQHLDKDAAVDGCPYSADEMSAPRSRYIKTSIQIMWAGPILWMSPHRWPTARKTWQSCVSSDMQLLGSTRQRNWQWTWRAGLRGGEPFGESRSTQNRLDNKLKTDMMMMITPELSVL